MKTALKSIAVFVVCLSASASGVAAEHNGIGPVQRIFALDKTLYGADKSQILIGGFTSAGSCVLNDGLVALAVRDDESGRRQMAVAMAAKASNMQVHVRVDDAIKNSDGQCFIKYIEWI